jgi:hypothetical protein
MTLDELRKAWEVDCEIDRDDLARAAALAPNLHAKYLGELMTYRLRITKLQNDMITYRTKRAKYYRGEMTREELAEAGWQQWNLRTLKGDVDNLIDADPDYQILVSREAFCKTTIYFLESVLGEIRSRSFHVKNIIEFMKFRAGA